MDWLGFWIFMAVFVVMDGWLYSKGHDGWFFGYKTDEEKEIRRLLIERMRVGLE